jgi:ubiquinone/menaquinone biosynthesis C-methylase UbiE
MGVDVVGIDIARNLVEAGKRRAAREGLERLKFQEGDACNLEGVGDHSFDLTLSVFGAMFAPKPFEVAREMVRVTRPGANCHGQLILTILFLRVAVAEVSSSFHPHRPRFVVR